MSVIAEQFAERDAKLRDRAVHIFKIPESLAQHGVSEIGLVEMTMAEELLATRRSRGDAGRLAYEYAKECLRVVDGKVIRTSDGSADRAWASLHPKVRQLVIRAYGVMHQPKAEEDSAFLESHEVRVG